MRYLVPVSIAVVLHHIKGQMLKKILKDKKYISFITVLQKNFSLEY